MEHNNVPEPGNPGQLDLFNTGEILTEVAVSALTTEPELRDIGRSLLTLVRYHNSKQEARP